MKKYLKELLKNPSTPEEEKSIKEKIANLPLEDYVTLLREARPSLSAPGKKIINKALDKVKEVLLLKMTHSP